MKRGSLNRRRILWPAGERGRQCKRTIVKSRVGNRAVEIRRNYCTGSHVELETSRSNGVAVLITAIDPMPHIHPSDPKAKTGALADAARRSEERRVGKE